MMRIALAWGKKRERRTVSAFFIYIRKIPSFVHRPPKEPFVLPTNRADSTSLSTGLAGEEGKGVREEEGGMSRVGLATVDE